VRTEPLLERKTVVKRANYLLALALLVGMVAFTGNGKVPAREEEKDSVGTLMKRKLAHSQKILEGLALNDFKAIAENAEGLIAVSKAAEWKVLKTPNYEIHSNDFRRNADDLIKAAKEKNIDRAALTYVELTLTCVKCHKHVREARWTSAD